MMDGYTNIKRPPASIAPIYDAPQSDECFDHCLTLNDADLKKLEADLPNKGDLVHLSVMGRVVGVGDDHGHRYARIEIEEVLFAENETTEGEGDEATEGKE